VDLRIYPDGLRELVQKGRIPEEWAHTLNRIEFRGKRPISKKEWEALCHHITVKWPHEGYRERICSSPYTRCAQTKEGKAGDFAIGRWMIVGLFVFPVF
jgi:hypothetical protein